MRRLWIFGIIAISLLDIFCGPVVKGQPLRGNSESDAVITDGFIRDPNTKLEFKKVYGISGPRDTIDYNYNSQHVRMSPNGKFLLYNNFVIPLEGGELIKLVDFPALRSVWSPDGKKIAFYSDGIWVIPVSPETGRPTGQAKEILDGGYMYQFNVQWSPDSEKVVFWTTDRHLSVLSVSDGKVTQLTQDAQYYVPGEWSPDGRWISFSQTRNSIWIIPSEGGQARKLAETKGRAIARWTPDGKWVFYQYGRKLHFVRVSDAASFEITVPKEVGFYVSQTKDGKKILFYKCSYEYTDSLKIVSSSGGESFGPRGLDLSAIEHYWSVDSKFILTSGKYDNKWTYWIIPLTGDAPFPLLLEASLKGSLEFESLSPDLSKMLFSQKMPQGRKLYWVVPVSLRQGKTAGVPIMIFDKGEMQRFSHWTSDGSKISFLYQDDLWMARTDGSSPVQLTGVSDGRVVRHAWSPDGSAIAWITYLPSSGKSILRMRRLSEDAPRDIAETSKYIGFKWSSYGRYLAYEFYDREKGTMRGLFVVSTSGGEPKKLIDISQESAYSWAWSPSGEELAVLANGKLLIFKMPDGESYQVGEPLDPNWGGCYGMKWSPDGREIALSTWVSSDDDKGSIFTVMVPEGKWTELTDKPGTHYYLSWSPDGKWISYDSEEFVKVRPEGILWEVEIDNYLKKINEKMPEKTDLTKD